MTKTQSSETDLVIHIASASYDTSRQILRVNGWCLSRQKETTLTLLIGDRVIEGTEFRRNLPCADAPDCGWDLDLHLEIPPEITEVTVRAQSGEWKSHAIRDLVRYDSDPYAPTLATSCPEALSALAFSQLRGLYLLQRHVHGFGNNVVNCFDIDAWRRATVLQRLGVRLVVRHGAVSLSLRHMNHDGHVTELALLTQEGPGTRCSPTIRLSDFDGAFVPVVISASEEANFDILFVTDDPPQTPHARINYIFCTYKRADYVQHNTEVFRDYMRRHKAQAAAHLTVVDNGSTDGDNDCGVRGDANVTVFPNDNTGGAGGFGRGIYESCYGALAGRNFTHVCLLDDDIYLTPEMFMRNTAFIRFLKPGFHVGAPMYPTSSPQHAPRRAACFGHKFRGTVHPSDEALGAGLETDNLHGFIRMDRAPDTTGWWWDCIAVSDIHRIGLPYPFFIKMDDVEYGLRLRDAGVELVIPFSFWVLHDDFEEKYSAAMQYFRFRNRWLLLALRGRLNDPAGFTRQYGDLVRSFIAERKYEHAQLLLDGMAHFLQGPEYLLRNEKKILAGIFRLVKSEKNVAMPSPPDGALVMNDLYPPASRGTEWLNRVTINNHFLPLKDRIAIDTSQPHRPTACRRGKRVSYWNAQKGVGFTVTRNSRRAFHQMMQLRRLQRRMARLPEVIARYREAMPHLTAQNFWATYGKFGEPPRVAATQRETAALQDLRRELGRLHIELQQRGALE
ncbi:MAG: hypothetical protein ACLFQL_03685, partial [Paracoccaceae bacterium]